MHVRDTHELTAEGIKMQRRAQKWKESQDITQDILNHRDGLM